MALYLLFGVRQGEQKNMITSESTASHMSRPILVIEIICYAINVSYHRWNKSASCLYCIKNEKSISIFQGFSYNTSSNIV